MRNELRMLLKTKTSFLERLRSFFRDKCFCFKNLVHALTKDMCFTQEEIDEIRRRVESTKDGNQKFHEWERVAPTVADGIIFLRSEIERLKLEKDYCLHGIYDLYVADCAEDTRLKEEIFARFGLPDVIEKSKLGEAL